MHKELICEKYVEGFIMGFATQLSAIKFLCFYVFISSQQGLLIDGDEQGIFALIDERKMTVWINCLPPVLKLYGFTILLIPNSATFIFRHMFFYGHWFLCDSNYESSIVFNHLKISRSDRWSVVSLATVLLLSQKLSMNKNRSSESYKCETCSRSIEDKIGEAKASGNLANTLKMLGRFEEAITCCLRHLELSRDLGDKVSSSFYFWDLSPLNSPNESSKSQVFCSVI